MHKKILFITPSFYNGGTNTALRNTLPLLKKSGLDVYVFAITPYGPNMDEIAKYSTLVGVKGDPSDVASKKNNFVNYAILLVKKLKKLLFKIGIDISPIIFKKVAHSLDKSDYDIVIAYQEGITTKFTSYFTLTPKIAWVHCDYKAYLEANHKKPEKSLYTKFSKIVCVSNYTKSQFDSALPGMPTYSLHNIVRDDVIIDKASETICNEKFINADVTIISIGRLSVVKRFDVIPEIVSKLKEKGIKGIKWYIIGGNDENQKEVIEKRIKEFNTPEVVLLGEINNPYPYLTESDIFVSTSISEACPYVLNEAKILGVPVVTTNYGSATEFITNGINGIITPIENITNSIYDLITDQDKYNAIKDNLSQFKYDNSEIGRQLVNEVLSLNN